MDNIDLFDKYIKGELSDKERHEFDTRLQDDKSFADDFKVYSVTVIGICKETEQDNNDFEVAMKNISKEQLRKIIGKDAQPHNSKTKEFELDNSSLMVVSVTAANVAYVDENKRNRIINLKRAQKIEEAKKTLSRKIAFPHPRKKFFMKWIWQAACWAVIIGGAAIWITRSDQNANYSVDNAIYASAYVYDGQSRGTINMPDLNSLSDKELKDKLLTFVAQFNECEDSDDIYEVGYPLAMSYVRLHERDKAKEILNQMIKKLSADDDYTEEVSKLKSILDILK